MTKAAILTASLLALLLLCPQALAKTLRVAVIDTGIDSYVNNLCPNGHKSMVDNTPLVDTHGHGTHIAGIISKYAGKGDYCIISIKFYDEHADGKTNLSNMIKSINYAIDLKVDLINISGGGTDPDSKEKTSVQRALNSNIKMIVAAGNNHKDLNDECYYPACYDKRLVVVGNLQDTSPNRAPSSNYGNKVNRWEIGTNVESTLPGKRVGKLTGTSQATAVASGKIVKEMLAK
jgi:subtilisin family serine protease